MNLTAGMGAAIVVLLGLLAGAGVALRSSWEKNGELAQRLGEARSAIVEAEAETRRQIELAELAQVKLLERDSERRRLAESLVRANQRLRELSRSDADVQALAECVVPTAVRDWLQPAGADHGDADSAARAAGGAPRAQ